MTGLLFDMPAPAAPIAATGWIPKVLGVDPSLTSTGLAVIDSAGMVSLDRVKTAPAVRWKRGEKHPIDYLDLVTRIRAVVVDVREWMPDRIDLAVMESPSYGSGDYGTREGAAVWYGIYDLLALTLEIPVVTVSPSQRIAYATGKGSVRGKGNARKRPVIAAMQLRHPTLPLTQPDKVDAFVLAAMVRDWWGAPLVPVPDTHRAALTEIEWPELPLPTTPTPEGEA